jgi:5,10-methylenetetrahydromethanopterin reductase
VLLNAEHEHRDLVALAHKVEELGLDGLWYADERFYREVYTGLAACAIATSRIRLGPGVTDPYTRHPALTALAIASLDELSVGRAVLGYGAGVSGFSNMGIDRKRPAIALRDGILIIRGLLAGGPFTYEGEMLSLRNARVEFPTRSDLPISVAANSPHTLALAGELGDGVIISSCASPLILEHYLQDVRRGQHRSERRAGPRIVARLNVSISPNRAAAMRQAKIFLARHLWMQYPDIPYLAMCGLRLPDELDGLLRDAGPFRRTWDLAAFRPFADRIPDQLVFPISLAGSPEEVAEQARSVVEGGVDEIMAYLLVPDGETMGSVLAHYAQAVRATPVGRRATRT